MNKKILFIDHDAGYSGSTISMEYLINAFNNNGFDVILLTKKKKELLSDFQNITSKIIELNKNLYLNLHVSNQYSFFTIKGFYFFFESFWHALRGIFVSLAVIARVKPDLIYINEYVLMQFSIGAWLNRIPSVTHVRSPFLKGTFGLRRKLLAKSLLFFNKRVFAITSIEANQIIEHIKGKTEKLLIVPEFLNENNFKLQNNIHDIKKSLQLQEGKKIILMLGGIEPFKGSYETLVGMNLLRSEFNEFYLIIAGNTNTGKVNSEYSKKCEKYINENQLNKYIITVPFYKEVNKLITIADVILSSSTISHFSRPVIEAWAKKKPVIIADSVHTREYVNDGVNGLIYKSNSPAELKDKLMMLFTSNELSEKLGRNGFELSKRVYDNEVNTKIILSECKKILSK